ncbi:Aminoglycoside acetyltransferase regulator [Sphingomonas paucimobilis]|nr:Aminoglycoside acetyltransferase regulator [Sphingomonas paucimobilis]
MGEPPETAFARFDAEPLAAASIAQVHRAALEDGTEVVLKIRRPGIRPIMEADLRLLTQFAAMVEATNAEAGATAPQEWCANWAGRYWRSWTSPTKAATPTGCARISHASPAW